jgi:CHAD domain-containing protein
VTDPAVAPVPSGRSVPTELLTGDVSRVARLIALELLSRVRKKAEDLRAAEDPKALKDFRVAVRRLRSWLRAFDDDLRDTLRGKHQRRLSRIADASRASRDLEVQVEWLQHFMQTRRKKNIGGADWVVARLQAKKAKADLELRRILDDDFDAAMAGIDKAMRRYTVRLDDQPTAFASRGAELIRRHAEDTRDALARVHTIGDRVEGHAARIAAKRLRYLVDALPDSIEGASDVIQRLTRLQDALGALHDAQLLGSDIARSLAKVLSAKASAMAKATDEPAETPPPEAEVESDRAEILFAISRRLHREETAAFGTVRSQWLDSGNDELWADVESVATALDEIVGRAKTRALRVERRTS